MKHIKKYLVFFIFFGLVAAALLTLATSAINKAELNAVMDVLDAYWSSDHDNRPEAFHNVDSAGMIWYGYSTRRNRIEVHLRVNNEEEIARFRETVIDSPLIVFLDSIGIAVPAQKITKSPFLFPQSNV